MKLLMITGLGGGKNLARGKRGALYNTLEEFHRYWERIDIILPKVQSPKSKVQSLLFGNVFVHTSPYPLIFHPWWFLKTGTELQREHHFDLMTVHDFPPFYNGLGARMLWRRTKIPHVLEVHHIPGYPRAANLKEEIYRQWWKIFAEFDTAKALAVRVVNQQEAPAFLKQYGVLEEKIKYIPSMYIDLDTFKPYPEIGKKYDLVFCSRLEKNKGIFNLIEAIKIAKRQKLDIKLLIIGSGPEKKNLEVRIKDWGLKENVIFSGWLETVRDVALAYNSAKIFVNPSFNEGGPRVVLEAMACGLPVVTTKVGLMHDLIRDGENGLFTDWDPAKLAEIILKLLNDSSLQNKFSQAGLVIARQFEKKAMIRNYAESLQKLIK